MTTADLILRHNWGGLMDTPLPPEEVDLRPLWKEATGGRNADYRRWAGETWDSWRRFLKKSEMPPNVKVFRSSVVKNSLGI